MIIVEYDDNTIGEVIRELRLDNRLTQKELAVRAGVSIGAVQNYEQGTTQPPIWALCRILRYLKVDEIRIDPKRVKK